MLRTNLKGEQKSIIEKSRPSDTQILFRNDGTSRLLDGFSGRAGELAADSQPAARHLFAPTLVVLGQLLELLALKWAPASLFRDNDALGAAPALSALANTVMLRPAGSVYGLIARNPIICVAYSACVA